MKQAEVLVEEIKQITLQYRAEVGSQRKPWPKAIISRAQELINLGFNARKISRMTGIPYYSILHWRHRGQLKRIDKAFHSVAVRSQNQVQNSVKTATVTVPVLKSQESATVTVTTPDGYQIKFASLESTIKLLQALRGH